MDKKRKMRDALDRDDFYMGMACMAACSCKNPVEQHAALIHTSNSAWVACPDSMPSPVADLGLWDNDYVIPAETLACRLVDDPRGATIYSTRCPSVTSLVTAIDCGVKRFVYLNGPAADRAVEAARLAFIQLDEFRGNINWIRDCVKHMEVRGLFR